MVLRIFAFLVVLLSADLASACACCHDKGVHTRGTQLLAPYQRNALSRWQTKTTGILFETAAPLEVTAKGLIDPQSTYSLTIAATDDHLTITSHAPAGKMEIPLGPEVEVFQVDLDVMSGTPTMTAYTEVTLTGIAAASGVFVNAAGASVDFTFAGPSSQCWIWTDFDRFFISAEGDLVNFNLFGELR